MIKMIPPVPTSAVMMPTPKQKIGFSIESIVGNDATPSTNTTSSHHHHHHHQTLFTSTKKIETQATTHRHEIQNIINRINSSNNNNNNNSHHMTNNTNSSSDNSLNKSNFLNNKGSYSPPPVQTRLSPDSDHHIISPSIKNERSPPPSHPSSTSIPLSSPQHESQTSQQQQQQSQSGLQHHNKPPLVVPGIPPGLVRPFPVTAPNIPDIKALPPYINAPEIVPPHQHNPHLIAAAQFQMAAALHQAGHVLGPSAAAAAAAGLHPHSSPFLPNPAAVPRDTYPLYPWLLSRHGRIFPHRFPGNFLLQPFRKPKRIRTAFSPSQLLKLEHAFESNQYVVGAERKALAQSLNLSETQVKVWFQNRRTKHKRMQQEDEKGSNNSGNNQQQQSNNSSSSSDRNANNCNINYDDEDDDELIDMEMDDCQSDEEIDTSH